MGAKTKRRPGFESPALDQQRRITMSHVPDIPEARPIPLTEDVAVTLPAHVWIAFCAAYGEAEWNSPWATMVTYEAQHMLFTTAYMKAREAHWREEQEQQHSMLGGIFSFMQQAHQPPEEEPGS
jgi:hypothetical protein